MKNKEKKSFHSVRTIRVSDEVWELIKKKKKGTWSHFLKLMITKYGNAPVSKLSRK